jgi:hypothetical protein
LQITEDDTTHAFTKKNDEAIYAFFQKHLNLPGDPTEEDVAVLTPEELTVTPTGQISTYLNGKFIYDYNKMDSEKLIEDLEKSRRNSREHINKVKVKAKELSGYETPDTVSEPFFQGRYQRDGYSVGKYAIKGEGNYVVPMLVFIPEGYTTSPAVIYLHPEGKVAEASPGGEIERIVKKGYIVVAPDVLGIGETKNTLTRDLADDYTAILIGRSIVGIQAADVVRVVHYLRSFDTVDKNEISAVAIGKMCPTLLHAAAFEPALKNVACIDPFISYRSIVMNKLFKVGLIKYRDTIDHPYEIDFSSCVAGALTAYDLPDLIGCIAPRKVLLANIQNQLLESASSDLINNELTFPRSVYSSENKPGNLIVLPSKENFDSIITLCFE